MQHRVPRSALLARNSRVEEDGTYVKPPKEKMGYATMVFVRTAIGLDIAVQLRKAVTIAVRYSASTVFYGVKTNFLCGKKRRQVLYHIGVYMYSVVMRQALYCTMVFRYSAVRMQVLYCAVVCRYSAARRSGGQYCTVQ